MLHIPDKMIDLCQGYIVVAFCDKIVYFDITDMIESGEEAGS